MLKHFQEKLLHENQNKWLVRGINEIAEVLLEAEKSIIESYNTQVEAATEWVVDISAKVFLLTLTEIGYIDRKDLFVEMRRELTALGSVAAHKEAAKWGEEELPTKKPRSVLDRYYKLYLAPSTWKTPEGTHTQTSEEAITKLLNKFIPDMFTSGKTVVFVYAAKSGGRNAGVIQRLGEAAEIFRSMAIYATAMSVEESRNSRKRYWGTKAALWDVLEAVKKTLPLKIYSNLETAVELLTT